MNNPLKIIIHHTGGTDSNPLADTSNHTYEIVKEYHQLLGWGKIGYHYFIEKSGKVTQGRNDFEEGAHTIGQNKSSLGICLAGNFDLTLPTQSQEDALRILLQKKLKEHGISSSQIFPHRIYAKKTCYGNRLNNSWAVDLIDGQRTINSLQAQIEILKQLIANFFRK